MLVGKFDVDEGGDGLHGAALLGVFDEVFLTGLVLGIPIEDVELGVVRALCGGLGRSGGGGEVGEGGVLELLVRVTVGWVGEVHLDVD